MLTSWPYVIRSYFNVMLDIMFIGVLVSRTIVVRARLQCSRNWGGVFMVITAVTLCRVRAWVSSSEMSAVTSVSNVNRLTGINVTPLFYGR